MKRIVAFLLTFVLILPAFALGDEAPVIEPPNTDSIFLPLGAWFLNGDGSWSFTTQTDATLTPEQLDIASENEIPVENGVLAAGTRLTSGDLFLLYPGSEDAMGLPERAPELELFALEGEWYYDDEDILRYKHGEGYAAMSVDEVFAALNGSKAATSSEEKIIYLTIDDTPSHYTMELLATLERLDVMATFFVVGAYAKQRPVFMRAIYEQGHAIANHSYSHDAINLSSSFNNCLRDFERCEEAVADALGFEIDMPILRVPYGSTTIPSEFRTNLQKHGYMWIDWNALNGDSESGMNSDQDVLDRAIDTASRYDGSIVMLVHDGKKRTIRTMEAMVNHFREQGYEFRMLDTNIEKIPGCRIGFPL